MHTEDNSDISRWVYREKIKMLLCNFCQSWMLSLLVSGLLCYLSVESGDLNVGVAWWLVFTLFILLRLRLVRRFKLAHIKLDEYEIWQKKFFWLTLATGVIWGAGAILIGSTMDDVGRVFILLILIGVSGGSIPMLGMDQKTMLAFQLPMVIPYSIWMASTFGRGLLLVFVVALYFLTVVVAMKRLEKSVSKSLGMRYRLEQRAEQLETANEKLEHLTQMDSLTQIYNRRYFEREMERNWKIARRDQERLALLMIDIDCFKLYNDTYGHAAGDECLRQVARLIGQALHRPGDILARIGGEEFIALLPGIDRDGAMMVAQAMQKKLKEAQLLHVASSVDDYVTVSIGVCIAMPESDETWLGLFQSADKALYKAKAKGRNLIVSGEMEKLEEQIKRQSFAT